MNSSTTTTTTTTTQASNSNSIYQLPVSRNTISRVEIKKIIEGQTIWNTQIISFSQTYLDKILDDNGNPCFVMGVGILDSLIGYSATQGNNDVFKITLIDAEGFKLSVIILLHPKKHEIRIGTQGEICNEMSSGFRLLNDIAPGNNPRGSLIFFKQLRLEQNRSSNQPGSHKVTIFSDNTLAALVKVDRDSSNDRNFVNSVDRLIAKA